MGSYSEPEAKDLSFGRNSHQKRVVHKKNKVERLKNKAIDKPIEVQGKNVTLVSGVRAYNNKKIKADAGAALITIKCPYRAGRIIVKNSTFKNSGSIKSKQGSAGIALTECNNKRVKVYSNNNSYINTGVISAGE